MAKQAFAVMLQEDEYRTYVGAQIHQWQQFPFGTGGFAGQVRAGLNPPVELAPKP